MRILNVTFNLGGGGAERQLSYLARGLAQRGHETHVAYVNGLIEPDGPGQPVHFHRLAARNNHDPRIVTQLIRLIRQLRPDVVHSWILQADLCTAIAAKRTHAKWIFREPDASNLRRTLPIKFRARRVLARWADAIVANSRTGLEYWAERFPTKILRVIRNGFPIDEIVGSAGSGPDPGGPGSTRRRLLYVGRLSPEKNIGILLEALPLVDGDIGLTLCGSGQSEAECLEKAGSLGLLDRVEFTGAVGPAAVLRIMADSDALALVSHFEGFPNVLIEAMLKRLPIMVSDIRTHREFLDESKAVLVDKDNAALVAKGISEVLSGSERSLRRVDRAFQEASQYTIPRMVGDYERLYNEMLGRMAC